MRLEPPKYRRFQKYKASVASWIAILTNVSALSFCCFVARQQAASRSAERLAPGTNHTSKFIVNWQNLKRPGLASIDPSVVVSKHLAESCHIYTTRNPCLAKSPMHRPMPQQHSQHRPSMHEALVATPLLIGSTQPLARLNNTAYDCFALSDLHAMTSVVHLRLAALRIQTFASQGPTPDQAYASSS